METLKREHIHFYCIKAYKVWNLIYITGVIEYNKLAFFLALYIYVLYLIASLYVPELHNRVKIIGQYFLFSYS